MISSTEFKKRRKQIARIIGSDSIAIIKAKSASLRNGDADYKYRPNSNFYYLSGCHESEAIIIIIPENESGEDILFCREIDPQKVIWHGPMLGLSDAKKKLKFDNSFDINSMNEIIPQLMRKRDKVYFILGEDLEFDKQIVQWTHAVKKDKWAKSEAPHEFISLKPFLDDMRVYKSKEEIKCMKKSANIAANAHIRMMQKCIPEMFEYQLAAEFYYSINQYNSQASYLPIVGGGNNACILHYINNNHKLKEGDLVLIDAGAEYDYYASDVTRTFPVNGTFNPAQSAIYSIVLAAHDAALAKAKVGNHWDEPHNAAVEVITQGLIDLGILQGDLATNITENTYAHYFMHKTGHWLGLDVHDCGEYSVDGLWVELEPNMVLTIEPGIYINNTANVPEQYKGIGIRIEDDILITKDGNIILSNKVPRTIPEIEQLMRKES